MAQPYARDEIGFLAEVFQAIVPAIQQHQSAEEARRDASVRIAAITRADATLTALTFDALVADATAPASPQSESAWNRAHAAATEADMAAAGAPQSVLDQRIAQARTAANQAAGRAQEAAIAAQGAPGNYEMAGLAQAADLQRIAAQATADRAAGTGGDLSALRGHLAAMAPVTVAPNGEVVAPVRPTDKASMSTRLAELRSKTAARMSELRSRRQVLGNHEADMSAFMHGITVLGDEQPSFDWKGVADSLANVVRTGVTYGQQKKAAEQATEASKAAAAKAIAADQAYAAAVVQAALSADAARVKPDDAALRSRADADESFARQAGMIADSAAAGLSAAGRDQRLAAAREALAAAQKNLAGADTPINRYQAQAAQVVVVRAMGVPQQGAPVDTSMVHVPEPVAEESFLTRKLGPLPAWGWGVGVAALGGLGYVLLGRK